MNELIDALRNCADEKPTTNPCDSCRYQTGNYDADCIDSVMRDAADAIERLQKQNEELQAKAERAEKQQKDFFLDMLFATDEQIAELRDKARRQVRDLIILGEENPDDPIRPN